MSKLAHTLFERLVACIAKYLIWLSNRAEKREEAQKKAEKEAHFKEIGPKRAKSGKTRGRSE